MTKTNERPFRLTKTNERPLAIEDDYTLLLADKSKLLVGQVIRNLMSNAIKFTPENVNIKVYIKFMPEKSSNLGDSSSNVSLAGTSSQNVILVIEIQDSGVLGISPENKTRLFKEVVQFNPEKVQGGGSGFGLQLL